LVQSRVGAGTMLLAGIGGGGAHDLAGAPGGRLTFAISPSPGAPPFSGGAAPPAGLGGRLAAPGGFVPPLHTTAARHSPQMAFLEDRLPSLLAGIAPRPGSTAIFSTVTGDLTPGQHLDVAYWARQLHQPVRFAQAIARLLEERHALFLEVSPHPIVKQ